MTTDNSLSTPAEPPPPPGPRNKILALLLLALVVGIYVAAWNGIRLPKIPQSASSKDSSRSFAEVDAAQALGDNKRARRILSALATKGNHEAQFRIGLLYEQGTAKHAPDIKKAVPWYRKAAAGGLIKATARLGHLYLQGVGVTQDFKRARPLLERAADAGNAAAQFDLARMWEHGWGGEKHLPMAYAWFEYSARQGYEPAVKARDRLLASLKPDQSAEGQKLLRTLKGEVFAAATKATPEQGASHHG
jgi:TPR repeat protein